MPAQFQRRGGKAKFVKMIPGGPFPDYLAIGGDLVNHLVELLRQGKAWDRTGQSGQNQRVARGKAAPIMVLLRPATRRGITPLPNDRAVPVQFSKHFVLVPQRQSWDRPRLAVGDNSKPQDYVAPLAANEGRVEQPAREAVVIPAMDLTAVHVDEMGLQVTAAEQDEDIV